MCPQKPEVPSGTVVLTEEAFEHLYEVLVDPQGCVLVDHHDAAAAEPNRVWTVIEVDGALFAAAGFHFVNRTGSYLLTERPWTTGVEIAEWSRDLERPVENVDEESE